jgi:hypothetical protein
LRREKPLKEGHETQGRQKGTTGQPVMPVRRVQGPDRSTPVLETAARARAPLGGQAASGLASRMLAFQHPTPVLLPHVK